MTDGEPDPRPALAEAVVADDQEEPSVAIASVVHGEELDETEGTAGRAVTNRRRRHRRSASRGRAPPRGDSGGETEKARPLVTAQKAGTKKNPGPTDEEIILAIEKRLQNLANRDGCENRQGSHAMAGDTEEAVVTPVEGEVEVRRSPRLLKQQEEREVRRSPRRKLTL